MRCSTAGVAVLRRMQLVILPAQTQQLPAQSLEEGGAGCSQVDAHARVHETDHRLAPDAACNAPAHRLAQRAAARRPCAQVET
jgi:hypothetical protein